MDRYIEIWNFISNALFPIFKFAVCIYVFRILRYVDWILWVIKNNTENCNAEGGNNKNDYKKD